MCLMHFPEAVTMCHQHFSVLWGCISPGTTAPLNVFLQVLLHREIQVVGDMFKRWCYLTSSELAGSCRLIIGKWVRPLQEWSPRWFFSINDDHYHYHIVMSTKRDSAVIDGAGISLSSFLLFPFIAQDLGRHFSYLVQSTPWRSTLTYRFLLSLS